MQYSRPCHPTFLGAWEETSIARPSSAPVQEGERDSAKGKLKRRTTVGPIQEITQRPLSPSAMLYEQYIVIKVVHALLKKYFQRLNT